VVAAGSQISGRGIEGTPLLIVEVLSPSTRAQDRGVKMRRYAARGVPHYWVLDPDAQVIECLRLEGGSYRPVAEAAAPGALAHPDWPDLVIDLAGLWR
jgi:Uma2 family endonuclease